MTLELLVRNGKICQSKLGRSRSKLGRRWSVLLCILLIPGLPERDRKGLGISVRENVQRVEGRRDPRVPEMRMQKA